ncbi:uncharacterized protein A4U43_C07F25690 [Asparagus officinalis]|uniref:GTD-binding domain-containing protein n=2 Tax=Asparagus officinalis TaxID=4686 RepID=A0A5P1EEU5_ASPOF|nr:uncharacterized protein A4U43_C07F25690 [Asparagus officinalis]
MDLDDAYKLATNSKGSLRSPTVSEVITGRDSSRAYEDLRILISHFSAARGLDSPWRELTPSPRVQGQGDDLKFSDASSSVILQNITKRLSIDRNESGFESLDGSTVGEIEGLSPIDRLKRQVELDRKSMHLLYKELEEERSASAVAANQALAMITRLQEEKAAIQMEALQYQRMMEEQAEYDQESLQYSNELLAKREKEIQDVEAELQCCKKRFGNKIVVDSVLETSGDAKATEYERKISRVSDKFDQRKSDIYGNLLIGFEDEKAYISDRLKRLERRLNLFSNSGMQVDVSSAGTEEDGYLGISYRDESIEKNRREALIPSDSSNADEYLNRTSSNLAALLNEVSRLNERLKDLEADSGFLENIVNTLRNGYDGVQYIQEIACHLQELRKIGITLREHNVA